MKQTLTKRQEMFLKSIAEEGARFNGELETYPAERAMAKSLAKKGYVILVCGHFTVKLSEQGRKYIGK